MPKDILPLEIVLQTTLRSVKSTCVLGSANKIADLEKSDGWIQVSYARNQFGNGRFFSKFERAPTKFDFDSVGDFNKAKVAESRWYYHPNTKIDPPNLYFLRDQNTDPLNDPIFNLTNTQKSFLTRALNIEHHRMGNCEALSSVLVKKLWELSLIRNDIKKIELASATTFNHYFVFVNRHSGTTSGWIIDPWYEEGIIQPISNFHTIMPEIKEFAKKQITELNSLGIPVHDNTYSPINNTLCEIVLEINTEQHKYPVYDNSLTINHYYIPYNYSNDYTVREKKFMEKISQNEDEVSKRFLMSKKFERIMFFINASLNEQKEKMKPTLQQIVSIQKVNP